MKSTYLQNKTFYPALISSPVNKKLALIVVIPAFKEPYLQLTLNSLLQNQAKICVEVIVCINYPLNAAEEIKKTSDKQHESLLKWVKEVNNENISFHSICLKNLPSKKAGVGYVRKVAMDEAARRFNSISNNKGIIVNLDADCLVSKNYLNAIFNFYAVNENCKAANIYFEHVSPAGTTLSEGIILYELHLRYIIEALKYCQYPYAYHTIGSSFCVNTLVYQQQGGMNIRKAGEDFYFLHKLFPLGNFGEIVNAIVYPSARISDRVPFGTGKSIADWENKKRDLNYSYDSKIFEIIKTLFEKPVLFYDNKDYKTTTPETLHFYLKTQKFGEVLKEIKANTKDAEAFVKRYYRYWSGFKLWKLIHYLRDNHFENKPLMDSCAKILELESKLTTFNSSKMLLLFREQQKKASYN